MLYISFTIGKLNCPVVDLGLLERLGFGSASVWCGCVAREAFSFGWGFINLDPLLGSTRFVGPPVAVLPKCSTGLKCLRNQLVYTRERRWGPKCTISMSGYRKMRSMRSGLLVWGCRSSIGIVV